MSTKADKVPKHEVPKRLLEIIVELICEEREISFIPLGSVTYSRVSQLQGCEPDSSYLIRPATTTPTDFTEIDPTTTAPDLVIEVDVTSPSVDKDRAYAAMGVREVWRWRGSTATIWVLTQGTYQQPGASTLFTGLTEAHLVRLVTTGQTTPQLTWRKEVRRWARDESA